MGWGGLGLILNTCTCMFRGGEVRGIWVDLGCGAVRCGAVLCRAMVRSQFESSPFTTACSGPLSAALALRERLALAARDDLHMYTYM